MVKPSGITVLESVYISKMALSNTQLFPFFAAGRQKKPKMPGIVDG
jgi:hypothetical protein